MNVIDSMKLKRGTFLKKSAPESIIAKTVVKTPRTDNPKAVTMIGGKVTAAQFNKIRGVIGKLFTDAGLQKEWMLAVKENNIGNNGVLSQKFSSYDEEFGRLHKAVQDTFKNAGRPELANEFAATVQTYTATKHPVDFIATLLKGAGSPASMAATDNQYKVLAPFRPLMEEVLTAKGINPPKGMADLTQVFYNTFVAKPDSGRPVMNFDDMLPTDSYHVDEAVVNAVVGYVKELSDKKASGETLPKFQDKIATLGLNVQAGLTKKTEEQVAQKVGETVITNRNNIMIITGVVLVVLAVLFFKK